MPIYEYRCGACGTAFERLVRVAGEAVACPACGSPRVARQLSVVAAPRSRSAGPADGGGCGCGAGGCGCSN